MGSLLRSEEMVLFQLFLHSEVAYECISELGELGLVHFRDLNTETNIHQRKFVNEVRRCNRMEVNLLYLESEIDKAGIPKLDPRNIPDALQPKEVADLEIKIENTEHDLREVNDIIQIFKQNLLELNELKHVLHEAQYFFDGEGETSSTESMSRVLLEYSEESFIQISNVQLSFVTGVIARERLPGFERMLWRAYRGNVFFRHAGINTPFENPSTGDLIYKSVFIVFFQNQLRTLVMKICQGFSATIYPCSESQSERREQALIVLTKIQDLTLVIGKSQDQRYALMHAVAKHIKNWFVRVMKMKAIYHTLNSFNLDVTHKCLIGECWIPVRDTELIKLALQRGMKHSESAVPPIINRIATTDVPPTFNRTNKFTNAFQVLVSSYGVAKYREINPTPYSIISFPFLFAIMFGDLGHGLIMFLFSTWMIVMEKTFLAKKIENEIYGLIFAGRYIIFLMGIFSMYTGFIYNDIFSISINTFGSHWNASVPTVLMMSEKYIELDPKDYYEGTPYLIGMDPIWQLAMNKINFLNSYKMKISIIIGVIHMLFGVSLSVLNYRYFNRQVEVFLTFLPKIIFMLFLFFYLVLLVFIKWVMYGPNNPIETGPGCAPSVLITFINMVLFSPGFASEPCSPWMYPGQEYIQHLLVITALICIPWMLIAEPIHKRMKLRQAENLKKDVESKTSVLDCQSNTDNTMMEVWITQGIHTIEYVLGSLSHTASYLRLWALSLAHAQLSEVLWKMVMSLGLVSESKVGGLILFLIFPCWAVLTVLILILMEGLSAFLHTLRLHWVEFQSKFYDGDGYPFVPFSFAAILDQPSQDNR